MMNVYMDSAMSDAERRARLYDGDVFVFGARPSVLELADYARGFLVDAFAPLDPRTAQFELPVERFVEIFAPVKPAFIHDPRTKSLLTSVIQEVGCDLDDTYLDVPRLRGVTSDGYLTSGVGYAHHPHRDTWYSAPMAQLNWWLPIYEFSGDSSMAFHLPHWATPVKNGSREFNYYEWNAVGRASAASQVKTDTRRQPKAEEVAQTEPQVRFVCPVGGMIIFSGAHLHSTVPNTSGSARFSIDFRTVSRTDLASGRSAPNIDSEPQGTSLRDFLRASDRTPLPDEIIAAHDSGAPASGVLVFKPENV